MDVNSKNYWPCWYHGPEEGQEAVFDKLEDVPTGWTPAWEPRPGGGQEPSLLDGNTDEIKAALADLSAEELTDLLAAETAGKSRKGVIAALSEAIEAAQA